MRDRLVWGCTVNIPERQTLSCSNSWEDIYRDHNCAVSPGFCKVTLLQVRKEPGREELSFGNGTSGDHGSAGRAQATKSSPV